MYRIGELSKICKLPVKTLRYYSSIGLLIPDEVDVFTGYRYYAASKIADCNRISALKTLGFSLDEIRRYLYAESAADIKVLIDAKSAELDDVICEAMEQKQRLSDVLALVTAEKRQMFDLVIREADAITVAYRRKVFVDRGEAATELAEMKRSLPTRVLGTRAVIIN